MQELLEKGNRVKQQTGSATGLVLGGIDKGNMQYATSSQYIQQH